MEEQTTIKHILWSIDAFPERPEIQIDSIQTLSAISKKNATTIEPVYVLSPDQINLSSGFSAPTLKEYKTEAEISLKILLDKINLDGLKKPTILTEATGSTRNSIRKLMTYAKRSQADLIAVNTRARKGVSRMLLGSFAETLLLISDLPILIMNPTITHPKRIKNILYPTDFSDQSFNIFKKVVQLSINLEAQITIFFKIKGPILQLLRKNKQEHISNVELGQKDFISEQFQKANDWLKLALEMGANATIVTDKSRKKIASSILSYAVKNDIHLIAMASQKGPISSLLIGSNTRSVIRQSICPVWVLHS